MKRRRILVALAAVVGFSIGIASTLPRTEEGPRRFARPATVIFAPRPASALPASTKASAVDTR